MSVQGGLHRALDLEDGRFPGRDRDDLVEDAHRVAVQRLLRKPHVRGRAVRENERWRADDAVLGAGLLVVAREGVEDVGISEVDAEAVEVETRLLRHPLHDGGIVEVLPVAMTCAQKRHVNVVESTLAARGFGGREGKASLHRLEAGAPHTVHDGSWRELTCESEKYLHEISTWRCNAGSAHRYSRQLALDEA